MLTPKEKQIVYLMKDGKANKQIALELGNTEDTIRSHVYNIMQKLDARNRVDAVIKSIENNEIMSNETTGKIIINIYNPTFIINWMPEGDGDANNG